MITRFNPEQVKISDKNRLNVLCDELRQTIYETVMKCGGHLASNLGAVESTVALFYTFNFPQDKIVFDVGHQCYAYKILSGRAEKFHTLRQKDGISGFPKRSESEYDSYDTGHAGTSISAALGLAKARDLMGQSHAVIAYIGDGSFNNGLVYEALTSLKVLKTKILIILNDNGMSISPTVGGMHDILSSIQSNTDGDNVKLLQQFGLKYIGVKNGNDLDDMLDGMAQAKEELIENSVLLHIVTKKGKGYEFSEDHPVGTHGVAPVGSPQDTEYSHILGETLCEMAKNDDKITVVSAAMKESLGLEPFFKNYAERAFDVGICEENAAVLCSSMAAGGLKPYYAIYSTFLQRAFDEIVHDVCSMNLPVTFCIDRAGISGADGETHQGVFDLSYLSLIPNLTIATPKDTDEYRRMLQFSATFNAPLAIRYPRAGKVLFNNVDEPIVPGKWEYMNKSDSPVTVLAAGERCLTVAMKILQTLQLEGKDFNIVNARFIKPLDENLLDSLTGAVITIEDNVAIGGFGSLVVNYMTKKKTDCRIKTFAYEDKFIPQGGIVQLQREFGVDCEKIKAFIVDNL